MLEEYCVRIYKTDPYFYEKYERLIKVEKNGGENILFKIDIYLFKQKLAVEIGEKGHTEETLFLRRKDKKHYKKTKL